MSMTEVRLVSRNVATGGGVAAAICLISSSVIGPGPLGIAATRPIAEAPYRMAVSAGRFYFWSVAEG
mgnify:CR=1 FL=1